MRLVMCFGVGRGIGLAEGMIPKGNEEISSECVQERDKR